MCWNSVVGHGGAVFPAIGLLSGGVERIGQMRVFVAGASGAIGEPLIAELLARGHSVVGVTTSGPRAKNLTSQEPRR